VECRRDSVIQNKSNTPLECAILAGPGWQLSWIPAFAGMTKEIRLVFVMPDLIRHPVENDSNFAEKLLIFRTPILPVR